jgi:hypothetical protein
VTPSTHLRMNGIGGCMECCKILASERMSYTTEQWVELASIKHEGFYDYSKSIYISSQTDVLITCPKHGEFKQKPSTHLQGGGCQKCGIEKVIASKLYTEDEYDGIFKKMSLKHANKYTYKNLIRRDGMLFIELICDKHGEFTQRYDHHKRGHGCFKCVVNYSKAQMEWLNYLSITSDYIQHAENEGEFNVKGTNLYADGYEPSTNTIYEFQGDFWHGNPKRFNPDYINPRTGTTYKFLYEKTQKKIIKLKELGYNVVEIWESDWDRAKKAVISLQRKLRN